MKLTLVVFLRENLLAEHSAAFWDVDEYNLGILVLGLGVRLRGVYLFCDPDEPREGRHAYFKTCEN